MSVHAGVALAGKNSQNAVVIVKLFLPLLNTPLLIK